MIEEHVEMPVKEREGHSNMEIFQIIGGESIKLFTLRALYEPFNTFDDR